MGRERVLALWGRSIGDAHAIASTIQRVVCLVLIWGGYRVGFLGCPVIDGQANSCERLSSGLEGVGGSVEIIVVG
jgi:hypothetical protein